MTSFGAAVAPQPSSTISAPKGVEAPELILALRMRSVHTAPELYRKEASSVRTDQAKV